MKLALISTPRSGNTWLRFMLASVYRLEQCAVHEPSAFDWAHAPENCIVQMHWHRSFEMLNLLARHGFQVVTIGRHPMDVLVSILHFCNKEPETRHWLLGEGGNEDEICGEAPLSAPFLAYGKGPRARALLSVTPEWWDQENVVLVRYEDLVQDTARTLMSACVQIGPVAADIESAVAAHSLTALRPTSRNDHFWQGRPGLWRELLTEEAAGPILKAHSDVLRTLAYPEQHALAPDSQTAALLWQRLA